MVRLSSWWSVSLLLLLVVTTGTFVKAQNITTATLDCSFRNVLPLDSNGLVTMQHIVHPEEGWVDFEITYNDIGWLAFGTASDGNGFMTGTKRNRIQIYPMVLDEWITKSHSRLFFFTLLYSFYATLRRW